MAFLKRSRHQNDILGPYLEQDETTDIVEVLTSIFSGERSEDMQKEKL